MKSLLFVLLCILAFTAMVSGILMVSSPDGRILQLTPDLLKGSPFKTFLIPGILLAVVVGGTNLAAVFFNLLRHRLRYNWAIAGGVIICGWIVVQVILIETIHWLHFVYLGLGILIILLAFQLKGRWAV
jgi:hypothetical protein